MNGYTNIVSAYYYKITGLRIFCEDRGWIRTFNCYQI
jgi:hypothetical protein